MSRTIQLMGAAVVCVAFLCLGGVLAAQSVAANHVEKAEGIAIPPTLTTEQKQGIQILAQRIELAQLRAQAAQVEFDKARGELATLLRSLQKDGFELNLQTLEYTKKAEATKKEPSVKK